MAAGANWGAAFAFVAIAGWPGQTVNGHLLHIGTRFIATCVRGDGDMTPPVRLQSMPLAWGAFGFFQAAVLCGGVAALSGRTDAGALAGLLGLGGWACLTLDALEAWRRAKALDQAPRGPRSVRSDATMPGQLRADIRRGEAR